MNYEDFKEKFIEDVSDRLYEQGDEVNISVHEVNKLNESYEAITVTPEGSNIGVNVGIDKFFGAYENGTPYEEVVDRAVDTVTHGIAQRPEFDVESLTDYSQMKEKLAMEVVSAEANKDLLETVPHKNMEDMAVVYRFVRCLWQPLPIRYTEPEFLLIRISWIRRLNGSAETSSFCLRVSMRF